MVYKSSEGLPEDVRSDYSKTVILTREDFRHDGHLLQLVTIPGNTKQRLHVHNEQTEVFYITDGTPTVVINGLEYLAKVGDAFICSPNDRHYIHTKTDTEAKILVFKINYPEKGEDSTWIE